MIFPLHIAIQQAAAGQIRAMPRAQIDWRAMQKGRSITPRPWCLPATVDQNAKVAWKKMRRAAEPEEKIPPASPLDFPKFGSFTSPAGVP
jgi:hypothetical protein